VIEKSTFYKTNKKYFPGIIMGSRGWIVVLNNPDAWLCVSEWPGVQYAVWQLEMGDSGTVHYQMWLYLKEKTVMNSVKRLEGLETAHLEVQRGTKEECYKYNTKNETRLEGPYHFPSKDAVEKWVRRGRGARTDIHAMVALVRDGLTNTQILEEMPVAIFKYQKGINAVRLAMPGQERQAAPKDCVLYLGPTGTGKSYRLRRESPEGPDWFWVSPGKWFDGYQGQQGLVFDEFRDNWQTYSYMLRLLDSYPFRVEVKGGFIQMKATRFRFSSNVHPKAWWSGRPGKVAWVEDPLRRRFSRIELMEQVYIQEEVLVDNAEAWWDTRPEAIDPAVRAVFGQSML